MTYILLFGLSALLAGCDDCDLSGYAPLRVQMISAAPAPPTTWEGCAVYTDIPHDGDPDSHGEALRHIGQSVYECLTGKAVQAKATGAAFYDERLNFRIDGECAHQWHGCIEFNCNTVDIELARIGPSIGRDCPEMAQWDEACWTQFYTSLGHEVAHGWLGKFHKSREVAHGWLGEFHG